MVRHPQPDSEPTPMARPWQPVLAAGPIYRSLADAIAADIAAGVLRPGDRLPPQRTLAQALGVDLTTVTRGYAEAVRRGLVQAETGRGTFVRGPGPEAARDDGTGPELDLSMNLPPLPPGLQDQLAQSLTALLRQPDGARLLSYQPSAGADADRQAGAAWLAPLLPDLPVERVLLAAGAQAALAAILSTLARAGDTVLTESFTYPGLRAVAAQLGLRLQGLAMDAEGVLPESLDAACRDGSPAAFCCTPTIQNPTTATMSPPRRAALAAILRRFRLPLVEDDAYGLLPAERQTPLAALVPQQAWYIATLSKCLMPALRLAYVVVPEGRSNARAQLALRAVQQMPSPLASALASRWIADGTAAACLEAVRKEAWARQSLAGLQLPAGRVAADPAGHHVWLRLARGSRADSTAERMRRAGLAVVPGSAFAVADAPYEALRLSLGAAPDRISLGEALSRVADSLDAGGGQDLLPDIV